MPAVLIGTGIIVLMAAFSALGMSALQHSNNTGFIGWLAAQASRLPIIGGLSVEQVLRLDKWITHQIGSHFRQVESQAVGWISGLSTYSKVMAVAQANVAAQLWSFAWWVVHAEIPRQSKAGVKHAEQTATHADAVAETAMKATFGVKKSHPGKVTNTEVTRIERVAMPHAGEWTWINNHWKALVASVTIPAALPGTIALPRVRDITGWTRRNLRWHSRRIARIEKLLGVTAFAAVMARTLGVSARCVRPGGNVSKVARKLCGLSPQALGDLLGLLADVLIVADVCQVIGLLTDGLNLIEGPLNTFVNVVDGALCHGDYEAPPALGAFQLYVPATTGVVLEIP